MMQDQDGTLRPMTEDELEANGYPRNFHTLSFEERIKIEEEHAKQGLRDLGAKPSVNENTAQQELYDHMADPDRFLKEAKLAVIGSYNSTHEVPDQLDTNDLYIVWFAKVLRNWKALVSTDKLKGYYFEVTFNGNPGREETYVDTYIKEDNQVFSHHDH